MENVLTGFVVVFLILFAALTLSSKAVANQQAVQSAWQQMEKRYDDQARTQFQPVRAKISSDGATLEFAYRNIGSTRLTNFARWDVILEYDDSSAHRVGWLRYAPQDPLAGEWTVKSISSDSAGEQPEAVERGIWNPGETLILQIKLAPPVAPGKTVNTLLAAPNGVNASFLYRRGQPPTLTTNAGLSLAGAASAVIGESLLLADDPDTPASERVYAVTTGPSHGSLNLGERFTQDEIDIGRLTYTAESTPSPDSFEFTVSDGENTEGPYTFEVTP